MPKPKNKNRHFVINPPKPAPVTPFFWMKADREDFTTHCALEFRLPMPCDDITDAECHDYMERQERQARILGAR